MKLELTRSECEAVASYIWNACRSAPTGKAFKVWEKMWAFINESELPKVESVIESAESPKLFEF